MGKKGSWFSAIKKVFLPNSKDKLAKESDQKSTKEKKKKGLGKLRHGDTNSFIPKFREPSSIEKILDEAEREHKLVFRPPTPPEQPRTPPFVPKAASPRVPSQRVPSPRAVSPRVSPPRAASPRVASPRPPSPKNVHRPKEIYYRPEPTLRNHHASATKIQAAYRGYTARRSFRALKGLVRLQGVVRGQSVKRQTMNAMKYMQMLVRVQSQIQSRRIQMLENQARRQAQIRNDKEVESTLGKWSLASEAGNNEDWDDSLLTKEEIEARLQKKVDAVIKRERAMSYAYSHQLWKSTPKSAQSALGDIRSNGFPWWWNWLERQVPPTSTPETQGIKNFQLTPPRPHSEMKPSPRPPSSSNNKLQHFTFDGMDTPTPRSSKSVAFVSTRQARPPIHRTPQANTSKYSRARASGGESPFDLPLKDDDSLMSCPPFSVPNYMAATASAKAKVRANSNPKERFPGTPSSEKRRLSFPLTQGISSFKWNKGSLFSSGKDSNSQKGGLDQNQTLHSIGNLSVDSSTVSMPASVGRKPFNRFV
ncbi:protein IQ-DOMAIN 13 isoform X2 [Mercurialis annua]|uniref:protein IQ-DOMAIN 13 isoform X2 n=1 Tax=Mercurialis annua TaxID=3986 RepID=UPI00215FF45F|nr:protein IQ-DOMAIN 13 isoform X2 [Mercurialis annua]